MSFDDPLVIPDDMKRSGDTRWVRRDEVKNGTYTPTVSAASNLDSTPTATVAQYLRIGKTVTVSGLFTANPTGAGAVSFEMTIPVASNFAAAEDLSGIAFSGAVAGQGAEIVASPANNGAIIRWIAVDLSSRTWSYTFTYRVI